MIVLNPRVWMLPNGEMWHSWSVDWTDENGQAQRRCFDRSREAVDFALEITLYLHMRKARLQTEMERVS
ncbi:hypothetical protein [Phenylobacterium sp.]|uniref:hypothetical protein n=1 Tax=Phenylobacterium sp. TaxID=1871053 RepID=UPI0035669653